MNKSSKHAIDLIFPLSVFFVFVVSAIAVLVLSANIYKNTTDISESNFEARTCSSYVLEKVRQSDTAGSLSAVNIDGTDCLVLEHAKESKDDVSYTTYIYEYENNLMELRLMDGAEFYPSVGTEIAPIDAFEINQLHDNLYKVTFTSDAGETYSINVGERSGR